MTFSIAARDASTGQLGLAATTSDLGVGARVMWGRARCGVVLTQHTTDPRLGKRGLDLLESGCDAHSTIAALRVSATCAQARQLAVVDAAGDAAVWSGDYVEPRGCLQRTFPGGAVLGNMLVGGVVGEAMIESFVDGAHRDFAARLLDALVAGARAGGERFPLVSAAIKVYAVHDFPYVDLRVDRSCDPLQELTDLNEAFTPVRDSYVRRALDPDVSYAADYAPKPSAGPDEPGAPDS